MYNDKYIKTRVKIYNDRVYTNFQHNKIPKENEYQRRIEDLIWGSAQWVESTSVNRNGSLGGTFCAPEANAFRPICSLKPVSNSNIKGSLLVHALPNSYNNCSLKQWTDTF